MKMLIKVLILATAIAGLILLFFYFSDILRAPDLNFETNPQVCYESHCFDVELAETAEDRSEGLMNRASLDKNRGMLFIFEKEEVYPFWMKNTLIPLDIVWLDNDGRVVYISKDNQPCDQYNCFMINPGVKARYVLEINAGLCDEMGLKIGEKLLVSP